jgi:hypothetical protein
MSQTMNQAQYATHRGVAKSYITKLKAEGRLVFTPAGLIDVAASDALIAQTAEPNRTDAVERHAAARNAKTAPAAPAAPAEPPQKSTEEEVGKTFHASKAVKEKYLALAARRDYEKSIGLLIDAHDAYYHMASVMTTCRATLERLPSQLAPELAGITDEGRVRQILSQYIQHALENLSKEISDLSNIQTK